MNNIVAERKASTSEAPLSAGCLFEICDRLDLTPVPLKPKSKVSLVRWSDESWKPSPVELEVWASKPGINWGVRCGENLAVIDLESEDEYLNFTAAHKLPPDCPVVKTGRGNHIWFKPRKPFRSQRVNGVEIKCLGSYVVAPPSIHPSGSLYVFKVAPNGVLPEVEVEELLGLSLIDTAPATVSDGSIQHAAPSDFALRYGKSPYPQSLCGKATKVITRSDGQIKHLLSMRCWKWHCRQCAPLLQRYWLNKLSSISIRFIIRLPNEAKPTAFLRRTGKPGYIHILANGESFLFLAGGEAERVWEEVRGAGYELITGDIAGDPTPEEVREYLEKALCLEKEPLNTRRKVSHSRGLFRKLTQNVTSNESKRKTDHVEENKDMNAAFGKKPLTWDSEVVMKPIGEMAKELEAEGWQISWKSEVEAIAIKEGAPRPEATDIMDLMGRLGVKLKRVGKEYMGLCPLHNDHSPSLSVNKEKGVWHCFGCGKGGDSGAFVKEMSSIPQ